MNLSRNDKISLIALGVGVVFVLGLSFALWAAPKIRERKLETARQLQAETTNAARRAAILLEVERRQAKAAASRAAAAKLEPTDRVPKLQLRIAADRIYVMNLARADIAALDFYLNGQPPFSWRYAAGLLPSGREVSLPLKEFAKEDGRRFNPRDYRITEIWAGGCGFDYISYAP